MSVAVHEQDRLGVRPLARDDAEWYAASIDPEIVRWSREELIDDPAAWWDHTEQDRLVIECCGDPVGTAHIKSSDQRIEISYWISSAHRRRGYASRALNLLTARAVESEPAKPIELEIHPLNTGSIKTGEKSGYEFHEMRTSCDSCADETGRVAVYRFVG